MKMLSKTSNFVTDFPYNTTFKEENPIEKKARIEAENAEAIFVRDEWKRFDIDLRESNGKKAGSPELLKEKFISKQRKFSKKKNTLKVITLQNELALSLT